MANFISLLAFLTLLICVNGQARPFYASGSSYPIVLPQYQQEESDLAQKMGFSGFDKKFTSTTTYTEGEWISWIKSLPREKQPFALINAEHLNNLRNPPRQYKRV
ncbi:uncharacterized protein LOC126905972 [Daktulosphaira vitifoliae]|uniref:uncharacterized protein LOC126905972 n=1 Tax=Daktulosphaira vitifoliae TaxID=58002 RepID=UPI0021AA213C|nr:uncharacterized protein LOC126905972 [Daktulosphaira vitifoliae]